MTSTRARSARFISLVSAALLGAGWLAACGSSDEPAGTGIVAAARIAVDSRHRPAALGEGCCHRSPDETQPDDVGALRHGYRAYARVPPAQSR